MSDRFWRVVWWISLIGLILSILGLGLTLGVKIAHAADKSEWFRSLMRPDTGTSCCNVADCHKTVADWRGNQWWAKVDEQWTPIPNEKVVKDHDSFDGEAYVCSGDARFIFCFVPPGFGS